MHSSLLFAALLLCQGVVSVPAPVASSTSSSVSSTETAPATTAGPDLGNGGSIQPGFSMGYTTVNGSTYPVYAGSLDGGYHFTGSGYSLTGGAGGSLGECYAMINGKATPVLCYNGHEKDSEIFYYGSQTFEAGAVPGVTSDVVFSGELPGPATLAAGGQFSAPGNLAAGAIVTPYLKPALSSGATYIGGLAGSGTAQIGGASFGGKAGGTFLTAPSKTQLGGGAIGSAVIGPFSGQGTIGGQYGTITQGCAGLSGDGVGYTACLGAPAQQTASS